ncbi:hypothetical protein GTZ97_07420 [Aquabacterium fontiphilum]|uniref:DUF5691 domain-containing protein n=1 Tax=Aquabacterium fontiphilum TaxID=450365 RepID=UPI001378EBE0|nr:DUF5691 domain-containing protein [Aquabacterium fontiphilum]NBD20496.1 hypothetical protein [Aquabacterium fontiphilum]
MSNVWTPLLPVAMVGTARQSVSASWSGQVGEMISQTLDRASDAPTGVLRVAGILCICGLAGAQGLVETAPLPKAAPDDVLPAVQDGTLLALIDWAFRDGPARLHHEVCVALSVAGYRLPVRLLPLSLDLGRRSVALRSALLPILGNRGLWLAAQRDDWRYATGVSTEGTGEAIWTDGNIEQRRAFLASERAEHPQAARERLMQALAELSANERADLVTVLAHELTLDDEPLLDALRADRSKEVRVEALNLLLRLPGAAHPQRAMARMAMQVIKERVLLHQRWVVEAPTAMGDDWKVDNLDAPRPPHESLGDRAWWLYQMARQVPLPWWTEHTGMEANELLKWAQGTDWHEALVRAWRDVLMATADPAWCEAFLSQWPQTKLRDDPASVLALLPRERREQHWMRHLRDASEAPLQVLVPQMLGACAAGDTLSAPLSKALAHVLQQRAASQTLSNDQHLRWYLPDLVCVLDHSVLRQIDQWPRHVDEAASFSTTMHAVTQIVATRLALQQLTTSMTP